MQSQGSSYSTEDDLDQDPQSDDYYDQYDYLPVQPPPSPGGPQYNVAQHHRSEEASPRPPPDPVWAQEAYHLTVETGDYHLPHPEELLLPTANGAETEEMVDLAPADSTSRSHTPQPAPVDINEGEMLTKKTTKKTSPKRKDGGESTYVLRIHEMLEDAERKGLTEVVAWRPHGRAFKIFDERAFVKDVLPQYFHAKIGSFRRWLRAWGFCRMTEGKDRGSWYHRYFVRGVTRLCKDLTRQQMASAMVGWPPDNQVPNFYSPSAELALTEDIPPQPPVVSAKNNPRLLRGRILEDLRLLLDEMEQEGNTHIISWQPHGRAFKIHDKGLFEGIMSRYFKTSLMSNLTDTLRIWGFRRLRQNGPDKGCFYHKLFVRGNPALSRHAPREEMRKAMAGFPPPEGEPQLAHEADIEAQNPPLQPEIAQVPFSEPNGEQHMNQACTYTIPYYYDPIIQSALAGDIKDEGGCLSRTYVMLLHDMLEDAEKEGNTDIVCWMPHGRAWAIKNEKDFVEKIMPRYFNAQMKSFLRWCRAWGFVRMTEGRDRGAWFHRYFVRGVTSLCHTISRPQMLKAMEGWLPAGQCPDFYSMWSSEILSETRPEPSEPSPSVTVKNPKRLRGTVPEDLRQMLEEAEQEGNSPIIAWCEHGRAFAVHDKVAFTDHILPRYFKASKFTYFSDAIRQWGFRRFRFGPDKGAFYHKLFLRGQPELTRHLTRIQMNESMIHWLQAESEPNLHDLPPADLNSSEPIGMEDDDNNETPLDADAIIAAAEQTEDIRIDSRPEISTTGVNNAESGLTGTTVTHFETVGI